MSLELIEAYNSVITETNDIKELFEIIDEIDDISDLNSIAESLKRDISILRQMNNPYEEIKLLNFKINCIYEKISELSEVKVEQDPVNFLFATSKVGKVYVKDDISSIDNSYYHEIKGCLDDIKNGAELKTFKNNVRFKNVLSYKKGVGKQVRVYMVKVNGNYICLFGVAIKKDNWSKKMNQFLDSRIAIVLDEVDEFKRMLAVGDDNLLKESENNYDNIRGILIDNEYKSFVSKIESYMTLSGNTYVVTKDIKKNLYDLFAELDLRELYEVYLAVEEVNVTDFSKNLFRKIINSYCLKTYGKLDSDKTMVKKR